MENLSLLVTILVSFCVHKCYTACSNGSNDIVEGVLGENITLSCKTLLFQCDFVYWRFGLSTQLISRYDTSDTSVHWFGNKSSLLVYDMSLEDVGSYSCYCYKDGRQIGQSSVCSVTLTTICQANVLLNGNTIVYNSSLPTTHVVTVTAKKRIKILCPEGADPNTTCSNVQPDDGEFTYSFRVFRKHNSCLIECQLRSEEEVICSVSFTLNVLQITKSTQPSISPAPAYTATKFVKNKNILVTDKTDSFPVIIPVGILTVILVGVTFVICFFILSSRLKCNARSNKKANPLNSSNDANIPIGSTYAIVNRSSEGCEKGDDDSMEQRVPCTDGLYSEVNGAGNVDSTNEQAISTKTETSVTNAYYSEVNISNPGHDTIENEDTCDSNLYSEVTKVEKQPRQKESPKAVYNHSISSVKTDQVIEQSKSSDNETVGDASTLQVIYAVVDKEKTK